MIILLNICAGSLFLIAIVSIAIVIDVLGNAE